MQKHQREMVKILKDAGFKNVKVLSAGRHPKLTFKWQEKPYKHTIANSPRCREFAVRYTIAQIKRLTGM
jgi:hypothetical protein